MRFYIVLLVVIAALFGFELFLNTRPFAASKNEEGSLTPLQEKQIELFRESNALLSTLATAAIGAIGALLFNRYKDNEVPPRQRVRATASVILSAVSIYCGYLAHDTVLWMLRHKFLKMDIARLIWSNLAQAWTFLIALLLLADFFFRAIKTQHGTNAKSKVEASIAIVTGVLMFCGLSGVSQAQVQHERTIYENLSIRDEVHTMVERWMKATGVPVEPEAQARIAAGFSDEQSHLKMAYEKQSLTSPEQKSDLTDALVAQYLYDVRDMKLAKLSKSVPALNVNRFLQYDPQEIAKLIITLSDVTDFSPSKFLAKFTLIFQDKVGELGVLSEPAGAEVTIDNEKMDHYTCRTFVASLTEHTVTVVKPATQVNCTEKVKPKGNAPEFEPKTVVCPKGKPVKCHLPKEK